jgi:Queuosine biosynthesis protein
VTVAAGPAAVAAAPEPASAGALSFHLPRALEAGEPPVVRDEVRLMVARPGEPLVHGRFLDLPRHLCPGDLLVVNASATIPAALSARRSDGTALELHLSTPEPPPAGRPDRWGPVEEFRYACCGASAAPRATHDAHVLAHASLSRPARGIHGCTTSDGPTMLQRTPGRRARLGATRGGSSGIFG